MDSYLYQATFLVELGDTTKFCTGLRLVFQTSPHVSSPGSKRRTTGWGAWGVREAGGLRLALQQPLDCGTARISYSQSEMRNPKPQRIGLNMRIIVALD